MGLRVTPHVSQKRVFTKKEKKGRVNKNGRALTWSSPLGDVAGAQNSSDGKWPGDGRFVSVFTSKPSGLLFSITVVNGGWDEI